MNDVSTIPVTVTPEAAERIADRCLVTEVDEMIAHARATLPEIRTIEVVLWDRHEAGDEPGIAVNVYSAQPYNPLDNISWDLRARIVRLFPADVLDHLNIWYYPGEVDAGQGVS